MSGDQHRVAWVTGAGKGIGRALAIRLAEDGWSVAVSARTASDLESLVAEGPAGRIFAFPLDITDDIRAEATVWEIEQRLGEIDLAVLNAGTHKPFVAEGFTANAFRGLVEANLMGTVHCLAPVMHRLIRRRRGHIAVVASLAGYRGLPTAAAYGSTKAALINMCEALQPDLRRHGVKLQLINPGFVKTPLTDRNAFPMPFLMPADDAVSAIMRGLKREVFEISFPWRFAILMKSLRLLPDRLFFRLTRRMIVE